MTWYYCIYCLKGAKGPGSNQGSHPKTKGKQLEYKQNFSLLVFVFFYNLNKYKHACGRIWNSCCLKWRMAQQKLCFHFPSFYFSLHVLNNADTSLLKSPFRSQWSEFEMTSAIPPRLQSGVNLQVCFVNDSSSDKDSDAEDTRTETSLDTPLSPVVCTHTIAGVALDSFSLVAPVPFNCGFRQH